MIFIEDILDWIVDNLNYTVKVDKIVDNGDDTYTLEICDTFILRNGKIVSVGGNEYKITDFEINKEITVTPHNGNHTLDLNITEFECYPAGVERGAIRDATKERTSKRKGQNNVVPFIWNRHHYEIDQNWEIENPLFGTARLEWYLLDETNIRDYTVKDDDREVIQPMYQLLDRVKELLREYEEYFNEVTSTVRVRPYKCLGVEDTKGTVARIFGENLSGLRVEFELEIFEDAECCKSSSVLT